MNFALKIEKFDFENSFIYTILDFSVKIKILINTHA